MSKARIVVNGLGFGSIIIDDVEQKYVTGFSLKCEAGKPTLLSVDYFVSSIEFEGDVNIGNGEASA